VVKADNGKQSIDAITITVVGKTPTHVGATESIQAAIDNASPGDDVVIIGAQGSDRIDVREMAAQIGTIPYEILCRIGSRIERVYT
jgi:alanine racemase